MNDIFFKIVSLENLHKAWREFRRGKRAKPDVQDFERHLEDGIFALHEELSSGTYVHGPYHQFHIFDPKHRIINKATVRDRLLHHAVHRVLLPLFDHSFIHDSYSCRVGKGTHAAVRRLGVFVRQVSQNYSRQCWALKFDIKKFFDSVDHGILLGILGQKISCPKTNRLLAGIVGSYRKANPVGGGVVTGTSGRSPVLRDRESLEGLLTSIRTWLRIHRRLELHQKKVEIRKLSQGIDFLGYVILPHHTVLRTKTKRRMLKRVTASSRSSYLGVCEHADAHELSRVVREIASSAAASSQRR